MTDVMMRQLQRWLVFLVALVCILTSSPVLAQRPAPIYHVTLTHGVTPPAARFAGRALQEAVAADASVLVVQIGDGGSVLAAVWSLARELHAAPIPVVIWIGPGPINGGPAAALLLAAGDTAAMAPGSTTGFAFPLASAPSGFADQTRQLLIDDIVREVNGWQTEHGRNVDWLERAVRSGAMIDAERARALDPPLIDLVAATFDELQLGLSGRQWVDANGQTRTLDTVGAQVVEVAPTALETLLQLLAVPTVSFVLFVLGAIAIYLELANPGIGVPGVAGATLVLAALYGFVQADVRPLAVVLLAGAVILIGLEHVVMSHGGLSVAGIILLIAGALWLVDPATTPGSGVAPIAIGGMTVLLGGAVAALVTLVLRVRKRAPTTGAESMIGQIAEVRRPIDPEGMVYVQGALWSAWSD
ncbi:MAG: hypothetical protein AVDCRST_MAG93-9839, partial [uncultured Chloroflexia bacterium]